MAPRLACRPRRRPVLEREVLLALHSSATDEIGMLRSGQFQTVIYSLGLDAAMISVFSNDAVAAHAGGLERWGAIVLTSVVAIALIAHLLVLHKYLTTQRSIRRGIERLLGVHGISFPSDGVPLLPTAWKGPISLRFQMYTFVLPIATTMLLFQLATCYLIFRVTA